MTPTAKLSIPGLEPDRNWSTSVQAYTAIRKYFTGRQEWPYFIAGSSQDRGDSVTGDRRWSPSCDKGRHESAAGLREGDTASRSTFPTGKAKTHVRPGSQGLS